MPLRYRLATLFSKVILILSSSVISSLSFSQVTVIGTEPFRVAWKAAVPPRRELVLSIFLTKVGGSNRRIILNQCQLRAKVEFWRHKEFILRESQCTAGSDTNL